MEYQPSEAAGKQTLPASVTEAPRVESLQQQASAPAVLKGAVEQRRAMEEPESASSRRASGSFLLLMADDDPEDCLLAAEAIQENGFGYQVHFVHDGEELLEYLHRTGRYRQNPSKLPDLILLDLNMPKLDGREALRRIKSDLRLRSLPVVILTTSRQEEDVQRCYQMGAASFLSKPATYCGWITLLRDVCTYWFERVRLPGMKNR